MINVTNATDGQGAFKNGMHDACTGVEARDNLYRKTRISDLSLTIAWDLKRFLWRLGHFFQSCTGLGHVNQLVSCGRCRHRHDPERMETTPLTGKLLLCKRCAVHMIGVKL